VRNPTKELENYKRIFISLAIEPTAAEIYLPRNLPFALISRRQAL
jgi:hypothetical protein